MWRRVYLLLILVRLYFALSPSYLHPDENFQGPEVIAGEIFNYPVKRTWEFTSDNPVRSVFPLWPAYGLPMLLLRWIWIGNGHQDEVAPVVVFWTLRVLMFLLSFVLEDWAVHDLVQSARYRRVAVLLVASSYVTWTYQTHTFSNSLETLLVAWSLVLIQRIEEDKQRSSPFASAILGFLVVLGVFNRITFPAFIIVPGLRLIPHFYRKPKSFLIMSTSGMLTLFLAIVLDTEFYTKGPVTWRLLFSHPIITPLNNLVYNISSDNLAIHGLHPWYQHFLSNLPQLLGPATVLLLIQPILSVRLYSAISGVLALSLFKHQEARFLIPAVPLILSSIQLPRKQKHLRIWVGSWIIFNLFFGVLMGIYHQGGIISAQLFLSHQGDATQAVWWKTYSPPIWLLDGKNEYLDTHDVMGMKKELMIEELEGLASCSSNNGYNGTYLVAPLSATYLDGYLSQQNSKTIQLEEVWRHRQHLNLDDLDFGDDGVLPTLQRVVGRRGLGIWRVTKSCLP